VGIGRQAEANNKIMGVWQLQDWVNASLTNRSTKNSAAGMEAC